MPEKYKNRYRIKSSRHPTRDNGSNAAYLVTICTHDRGRFFRKNNGLQNAIIVYRRNCQRMLVANTRTFYVRKIGCVYRDAESCAWHYHYRQTAAPPVQTQNIASLPGNKFGPQSQNLASIVRGFKIGVTKNAREYGANVETQNFASLPFKMATAVS